MKVGSLFQTEGPVQKSEVRGKELALKIYSTVERKNRDSEE